MFQKVYQIPRLGKNGKVFLKKVKKTSKSRKICNYKLKVGIKIARGILMNFLGKSRDQKGKVSAVLHLC